MSFGGSGAELGMARTVLTDAELGGLIMRILMPGKASEIKEWMRWLPDTSKALDEDDSICRKDLGVRDFRLHFKWFKSEGDSVKSARFQIWRKSRLFSTSDAKDIFDLIFSQSLPRYPKDSIKPSRRPGIAWAYTFANELEITLETRSSGQISPDETNTRNDFVCFIFDRLYW